MPVRALLPLSKRHPAAVIHHARSGSDVPRVLTIGVARISLGQSNSETECLSGSVEACLNVLLILLSLVSLVMETTPAWEPKLLQSCRTAELPRRYAMRFERVFCLRVRETTSEETGKHSKGEQSESGSEIVTGHVAQHRNRDHRRNSQLCCAMQRRPGFFSALLGGCFTVGYVLRLWAWDP